MFDLRYHVASLAAVFLALIIGILVGAGLAARTDVEGSERRVLEERIAELQRRETDLTADADLLQRQREAVDRYVGETYRTVMNGRLRGMRVAVLFVGQSDDGLLGAIEQTLEDASAPSLVELEALELPIVADEVSAALEPQFTDLSLEEIGRRLSEEMIEGGETPFWDALIPVFVQDHRGTPSVEADAVVVLHTAVASDMPTRKLPSSVELSVQVSVIPFGDTPENTRLTGGNAAAGTP